MNDNERYIEEFVRDIPFEASRPHHRDGLKERLLDAYPKGRSGWTCRPDSPPHPKRRVSLAKLTVAAVIVLGLGALLGQLGAMLSDGSVAWADVVAQFQTVRSFNAVIYMKNDATSTAEQMELWWNRDGRMRMRLGTQVVFVKDGQIVRAYDIEKRRPVEPSDRTKGFLGRIALGDEFSLNAVIDIMFGGKIEDVTPLVNPDAVISQDIVVFDIDMPGMSEWARIWALRESRLPTRIRVWDPSDGAATDALFEYSQGQAAEFFDPDAFEALLDAQNNGRSANVAYAFLKDPGGRSIRPGEMFEKSGYHVPVVKRAGMTEDGVFWVLAEKALNRRASGSVFHGFARISDDLDRTYVRAVEAYHGTDDVSLDVFVPVDFPFDRRRPSRITLVCSPRRTLIPNAGMRDDIVGTLELTAWEPNAPYPVLYEGLDISPLRLQMDLARHLIGHHQPERLERLLQAMPGWETEPENKSLLLFWQEMTCRRRDFQETLRIGQALSPLLLAKPERTSRYHFTEYLIALAATGRLDDARKLYQRIDAIDNMSPKKSDERYYGTYLRMTIEALARDAGLKTEQINGVIGFDLTTNATYQSVARRGRREAIRREAATQN